MCVLGVEIFLQSQGVEERERPEGGLCSSANVLRLSESERKGMVMSTINNWVIPFPDLCLSPDWAHFDLNNTKPHCLI